MYKIPVSLLLSLAVFHPLPADQEQLKGLTVTGEGKSFATPTIADVRMGIEADGISAPQVQQNLATVSAQVYRVLQQVEAQQLQTGGMNIYPQYSNDTPQQIVRYRGNIEISFSVLIEKAGRYIDASLSAGANKMTGFSVRPDDEALGRAKLEALQKACQDAIQKSTTVLKSLGLQGKKIIKVDIEPSDHVVPIRPYPMMMAKMSSAETEILSTEQEISGKVLITISLD